MFHRSVSTPLDSVRRRRRASRPLDSSHIRAIDHVAPDHNNNLAQTHTHDDNYVTANTSAHVSADNPSCRRSDINDYGRAGAKDLCSSAGD
jgi:hypothetical protein